MMGNRRLDIGALHKHLRIALRQGGAQASRMLRYTPEIIDIIYPAYEYPDCDQTERALRTQADIRRAVDAIGGTAAQALAALLCLNPGTRERTLEDRRRIAADYLGVSVDTVRRDWHEGALLFDLTIEIFRLHNKPTQPPEGETT